MNLRTEVCKMFKMTVEKFMKLNDIVSISGPCENKRDFSNILVDDSGKEYTAYIPLSVDLVIDDSLIMICLKGDIDTKSLKGLVLRGQAD